MLYVVCSDESEVVIHSDDAFATVAFLRILKYHTEEKNENLVEISKLFQNLEIKHENGNTQKSTSVGSSVVMKRKGESEKASVDARIVARTNLNVIFNVLLLFGLDCFQ